MVMLTALPMVKHVFSGIKKRPLGRFLSVHYVPTIVDT